METKKLSEEWQDIAAKTLDLLSDYISKYDHISEVILTWVRPDQETAPPAEAIILTVEEQSELVSSRNSGWSVKIVGIGTMDNKVKSDEQMGFAVPKSRRRSRDVEQGPVN
jgi:hypothetical protein